MGEVVVVCGVEVGAITTADEHILDYGRSREPDHAMSGHDEHANDTTTMNSIYSTQMHTA